MYSTSVSGNHTNFSLPLGLNQGSVERNLLNFSFTNYFDPPPPPMGPGGITSNLFNRMDFQIIAVKDTPMTLFARWVMNSLSHYWASDEEGATSKKLPCSLDTLELISKELHPSAIQPTVATVCPLQMINAVEAALEGRMDVLERCLNEGLDLSRALTEADTKGCTPIRSDTNTLMKVALCGGHLPVVRFLVEEAGLKPGLILQIYDKSDESGFREQYPDGVPVAGPIEGWLKKYYFEYMYRKEATLLLDVSVSLIFNCFWPINHDEWIKRDILEYFYTELGLAKQLNLEEVLRIFLEEKDFAPMLHPIALEWIDSKPELKNFLTAYNCRGNTLLHEIVSFVGQDIGIMCNTRTFTIEEAYSIYRFYRGIHLHRLRNAEGQLAEEICPEILRLHTAELERARAGDAPDEAAGMIEEIVQEVDDEEVADAAARVIEEEADEGVEEADLIGAPRLEARPVPQVSEHDIRVYAEILKTLAEENVLSLRWNREYLEGLGEKVDHIHPFSFFELLFINQELRNDFTTMLSRLNGIIGQPYKKKLLQKLKAFSLKNQLVPYASAFAKSTLLDEGVIQRLLYDNDLNGLLDITLSKL